MKRFFPIPFVAALFTSSFYSLFQIWNTAGQIAWVGAAVAVLPMTFLFAYVSSGKAARLPNWAKWHMLGPIVGSVLVWIDFQIVPAAIALVVGLALSLVYDNWYAPLDRSLSKITAGQTIPFAGFVDIDGNAVTTAPNGKAQVWLFVRGNWCPFCVAQAKELADSYQQLSALGAEVNLVTPQSAKESRKLAVRFGVEMKFLVDKDVQGAKALGIAHLDGLPAGIPGDYDNDTIMPTVVITDPNGIVIYADQTDDYRKRPEPGLFLEVLRSA